MNLKQNFLNQKQKHNVIPTLYHETNTKTIGWGVFDKKPGCFYEFKEEILPKPSAGVQMKYLKYTLN